MHADVLCIPADVLSMHADVSRMHTDGHACPWMMCACIPMFNACALMCASQVDKDAVRTHVNHVSPRMQPCEPCAPSHVNHMPPHAPPCEPCDPSHVKHTATNTQILPSDLQERARHAFHYCCSQCGGHSTEDQVCIMSQLLWRCLACIALILSTSSCFIFLRFFNSFS